PSLRPGRRMESDGAGGAAGPLQRGRLHAEPLLSAVQHGRRLRLDPVFHPVHAAGGGGVAQAPGAAAVPVAARGSGLVGTLGSDQVATVSLTHVSKVYYSRAYPDGLRVLDDVNFA